MKRVLSLTLVLLLMLMFSSCLEIEKKRDRKEMLHIEEKIDMGERTIDISAGIENEGKSFSYSCDLDYDGNEESISISIETGEENQEMAVIEVGDKTVSFDSYDGYIEKVYSCDIIEDDRTRDIAIITLEGSGDPRIRILSYKNDLEAYIFNDGYKEEDKSDYRWLGYTCNYYFEVSDEGNITVEEQTNSTGMWSVYKKYELVDGMFKEIHYDKYIIRPDFMAKMESFGENVTDEEKEKWKNGYIKAYTSYSNESILINEGEYIKPLYDNDKNKIYVEKEDGETGYINISYTSDFERDAFNEMFFYLAG